MVPTDHPEMFFGHRAFAASLDANPVVLPGLHWFPVDLKEPLVDAAKAPCPNCGQPLVDGHTCPELDPTTGEIVEPGPAIPEEPSDPTHFSATVAVNAERFARATSDIYDEVLKHLAALPGAKLNVQLIIEAEVPDGIKPDVKRVVSENANTLGFTEAEFNTLGGVGVG